MRAQALYALVLASCAFAGYDYGISNSSLDYILCFGGKSTTSKRCGMLRAYVGKH